MRASHAPAYCLSKLKTFSTATQPNLSLSHQSSQSFELSQQFNRNSENMQPRLTWKAQQASHTEIRRSYDMIARQINCSAAVSIKLKTKLGKRRKREQKKENNISNFIENIEEIFKELVPHQQPKVNISQFDHNRKKTIKINNFIPNCRVSDEQESIFDNSNECPPQMKEGGIKQGFYSRLKKNLGIKMGKIGQQHSNVRLSNAIQNKAEDECNVSKVLKMKMGSKNNDSFLRLSRTGMVIPLSEMQRKAKEATSTIKQNQKVRKQFAIQKCLAKNCEATLNDITRFQYTSQASPPLPNCRKTVKHMDSTVLRKTHSSEQRLYVKERNTVSSLSVLRWREKCLKIELDCQEGLKRNREVQRGMKVFGKYCRRIHQQLKSEQTALTEVLGAQGKDGKRKDEQKIDVFCKAAK